MKNLCGCRQILLKLLSNAAKFCSEGGRVEIRVAALPETVTIVIFDDGVGISPADLSRLGQPFEQVTRDAKLARCGTGLGLALVYALVEKHGGRVKITSQVGDGTHVCIQLPRKAQDASVETDAGYGELAAAR